MNNMHKKLNLEAQEPRYEAPALDSVTIVPEIILCVSGEGNAYTEDFENEVDWNW